MVYMRNVEPEKREVLTKVWFPNEYKCHKYPLLKWKQKQEYEVKSISAAHLAVSQVKIVE